jgi:hypothetical protein
MLRFDTDEKLDSDIISRKFMGAIDRLALYGWSRGRGDRLVGRMEPRSGIMREAFPHCVSLDAG